MTGLKRGSELAAARVLMLVGLITAGLLSAAAAYAATPADCAAQADRANRDQGTVLGGAGRGAVRGAALGGIVGGSDGARSGAAIGAVAGSARRNAQRNDTYKQVYDSCMRGSR